MAPSKKIKVKPANAPNPAKRGRQADKSDKIDAPAAKKRSNDKTKALTNTGANSVCSLTSDQPRMTTFCDLEDEESLRKYTGPEKKICPKPMVRPIGEFPRFKDGDVFIELVYQSSKHTYQLHGSLLQRASPWFDKVLRVDWTNAEPDPQIVSNHPFLGLLWARFELKYNTKLEMHELARTCFTQIEEAKNPLKLERSARSSPIEDALKSGSQNSVSKLAIGALNVDVDMITAHGFSVEDGCSRLEGLQGQQASPVAMKPNMGKLVDISTPKVIKDDLVSVREVPVEDVVMIDIPKTTEGRTKEKSTQHTETIDLTQEIVDFAAVPIQEEQPLMERKEVDDGLKMDEGSDAPVSRSAKEVTDHYLAMVNQDISASIQRKSTPDNEVHLSMGADNGQDIKVEAIEEKGCTPLLNHNDALQENDGFKDEKAIKQEDLEEIAFNHGSDPGHSNASEDFPMVHHAENIEVQVHTIERDVLETIPTSMSADVTAKLEESPLPLPENQVSTQEMPAPSLLSGVKVEKLVMKQEFPSLTHDFGTGSLIKDKDVIKLTSKIAVEEDYGITTESLGSLESPASSGLEDVMEISQEPDKNIVCTPETSMDHSDSDFSNAAGTKGVQETACLPKSPQGSCEKLAVWNDDFGGSVLPSIPQGDGSSEDLTFMNEMSAKAPSAQGHQRPSSKNSHRPSPYFVFNHEPIENHKKPVDMRHPLVSKSVSGAADSIRESQSKEGLSIVEERSSNAAIAPVKPVAPFENLKITPVSSTDKPSNQVLSAYNNLFLIYYSRPPIIDTENVEIAYEQSHLLIKVATLYGSLPVVRPYVNSALMHFGRELYMAIMVDPPRWIQLSMYLESAPIFRETIIHIVGNLRNWPWASLPFDDLFSPVKKLIGEKMTALKTLKDRVNKSLYSNTVEEDVDVFLRPVGKDNFDTWFVVQYWRDWFTRSLAQANKASDDGDKCTRGKVYRDLHRSGEAYLATVLVLDAVEACRAKDLSKKSKRQGIEQDLKTLKDFAQKEVQELCTNNSMLSVEDAGITYLTCIKVENDELPWLELKGPKSE